MSLRDLTAEKVRELREAEGLSQAQFAERLGMTGSYIGAIETGRKRLTDAARVRIALEFRVNPDKLVGIEPDRALVSPEPEADTAAEVELMDRLSVCAGFGGLADFMDTQTDRARQIEPHPSTTLAMLHRVRERGYFKPHEARRLVGVLKKLDGQQRPLLPGMERRRP